MRLSKLLGRTFRQPPADARLISHALLVRAGFARTLEGGLFAYLPLGQAALGRLEWLVRRQLAALEAQEVGLPVAAAVPDASGANRDRAARSPKGEEIEMLVRLAGREIDSYRQLPLLLYHRSVRVVPHTTLHVGLFGAGERPLIVLTALESANLGDAGPKVEAALGAVFGACDLPVLWARSGEGGRGAFFAHAAGDEEVVHCSSCGDAAQRAWATAAWPAPPPEPELAAEEIATRGCDTIATLAAFLSIPTAATLKMVFYSVDGKVTCVVIRGDRQVDEAKLARMLGTTKYYTSVEDELAAVGAVGGYASPIGLDARRVRVVADPSVRSGVNFVSGANRAGYHIRNVNLPRDFVPGEWADLALVEAGDACPRCGAGLEVESAFELAHTGPAGAVAAEYRDESGRARPVRVASGQLDLGRLLAAVAEAHHDQYGLVWPIACAPFDVHLVALDLREEIVATQAEAVYDRLRASGYSVLYDDRDASAGVKFNDADLIGIPLRLTISKRWLADGRIEARWRDSPERLKLDDTELAAQLARLREVSAPHQ